jgi:hypothetical protein
VRLRRSAVLQHPLDGALGQLGGVLDVELGLDLLAVALAYVREVNVLSDGYGSHVDLGGLTELNSRFDLSRALQETLACLTQGGTRD